MIAQLWILMRWGTFQFLVAQNGRFLVILHFPRRIKFVFLEALENNGLTRIQVSRLLPCEFRLNHALPVCQVTFFIIYYNQAD